MKNLLIVDDEDIILEMLVEFFNIKGFNVYSAPSEELAKQVFDNNAQSIDVVILDMLLKNSTSDDLFYYMKQKSPDLKIFISSGLSREDCDPDIASSAHNFVKKPYIMEDLYNMIQKC